jgi:hypothetical protein
MPPGTIGEIVLKLKREFSGQEFPAGQKNCIAYEAMTHSKNCKGKSMLDGKHVGMTGSPDNLTPSTSNTWKQELQQRTPCPIPYYNCARLFGHRPAVKLKVLMPRCAG